MRRAAMSWSPSCWVSLLVAASCSQAAAVTSAAAPGFLSARAQDVHVVTRKAGLLVRKAGSPGYWDNDGVRGGAGKEDMGSLGDSGGKVDGLLDRNWVTGDSMAKNFDFLDNLNPTAPMDRLPDALGRDSPTGHYLNPVYVPEYLNPDMFPVVSGSGCNCSLPTEPTENVECSCGKNKDNDHYTWLKDTPVFGTNNYTLEPADITYRGGNYWGPETRDGIVAPADALPLEHYPNQAPGNHIFPLPASAQENRIAVKYTRYLDQVHARGEECDTVSKKCTTPCKPGDMVDATIGNMLILNAKVVKTFAGNAAQIEFIPPGAETAACPVEAACTSFRYCKSVSKPKCVEMKDKESFNWAGMLKRKSSCPTGTKACATVNQVLMATMLKKGDKTCKAVAR